MAKNEFEDPKEPETLPEHRFLDDDLPEFDPSAFEEALPEASEEVPETPEIPEIPDIPEAQEAPAVHRRRRTRRKPIKRKGSGLWGIPHFLSTVILWAMVLVIGVGLGRVLWLCADDVLALTKEEKLISITISDEDTMNDISEKLEDLGLIRYAKLFNVYCSLTSAREKIDAGEFELNSIYDYHAMVDSMNRYSVDRKELTVTIPEGYECRQIFELLEDNEVCTVEQLEEAAKNGDLGTYWFLEGVDRGESNCLEGFLFPDTYNFYTNDDPDRVLRKLLNNFEYRFDDDMIEDIRFLNEWLAGELQSYGYDEAYIESQMLTVRDVITVASMIERETAGSGESDTIASVIYNRLCSPDFPLLNIDATIQYALGERKPNLSAEDLKIDSPYNTYLYPGLPAGPISNPGLISITAALHPEDSSYFYYALDDDGTHYFSETYEEHLAFLDRQSEDDNG